MFCKSCGAKIPENFRFCTNCGTRVQDVIPLPNKKEKSKEAKALGTVIKVVVITFIALTVISVISAVNGLVGVAANYADIIESAQNTSPDIQREKTLQMIIQFILSLISGSL